MCVCVTIIFNSIVLTILVVMLFSKLEGFEEISERFDMGPEVWASAVLVTLITLRIGQGGLFFLGAQYRFNNNLVIDALAVVVYLMSAIFLYSTAHMLFRATGAPYLFEGSLQDYISFLYKNRKKSLYSQFFVYWTTASQLIVYGPYEPFLQLAISCGCTILVLNNIAVVVDAVVSTCVTALDSLSDEGSTKAIMITTIFFIALSSFFINSEAGFETAVAIENTVIPAVSAFVVLLELLVIGILYGFPRAYANVLAMGSDKEDNLLRRVSNLFYLYFWQASPFLILASVLYAFPSPPKSMRATASLIIFLILMPTATYCFQVFRTYHRIGNIRLLFVSDYVLWGPRMSDDRDKANRMEKKASLDVYVAVFNHFKGFCCIISNKSICVAYKD
ncbi:hypothetical protein Y032_0156g3118 [Ancylostoma ceylanicum]|uniref:Sodium:neurotransmitter symporter family protein n=1 Tax=Ancylostoma ceylanicum TaxID=53326 RepID=A0A016SZB3_9BILA|nr:hypothetical protein Y032_0156g3118 [Ancylostoma ceylanicum]